MAGDADHDGAGAGDEVVLRGQLYRRIGRKPHSCADGVTTKLAVWQSTYPAYGEPFTFDTTRLRKLHAPQPAPRQRRHRRRARHLIGKQMAAESPSRPQ
jgi:hypothetical protein